MGRDAFVGASKDTPSPKVIYALHKTGGSKGVHFDIAAADEVDAMLGIVCDGFAAFVFRSLLQLGLERRRM